MLAAPAEGATTGGCSRGAGRRCAGASASYRARSLETSPWRWVIGSVARWAALCAPLYLSACASAHAHTNGSDGNAEVLKAAEWFWQNRPPLVRRDCSGLVTAILQRAGRTAQGGSRALWEQAEREGRVVKQPEEQPRPGDLAFFDHTYDANRNGKVDDLLTHVALVLKIDDDDTVHMLHYGSRAIRWLRLNPRIPSQRRLKNGKIINDYLRSPSYGGPEHPRLAGELLRGYARPPEN